MSRRTLAAARVLAALLPIALVASVTPARADVTYQAIVQDANPLGLTVTNYGVFGNNFVSRSASFEYPFGSGFEHLVRAGLWVGAQATDGLGTFTGVVTGSVDGATGQSMPAATEWTPMSNLEWRSALPYSRFFHPMAASDLDMIAEYDDHVVKRASGTDEDHRPMGISVRQRVYAWNTPELRNSLILRFVVRNTGANALTGVNVGFYGEFASGNKNAYSVWPPVSIAGPGRWYGKSWIAYDDTMRLLREHFCYQQPVPAGCNLASVPYWVGLKLLTRPAAGQAVTLEAWSYAPNAECRNRDVERYAILASGLIHPLTGDSLMPETGDPIELLGLGPFASIAPGDSVTVDFALVGGAEIDSIQTAANAVQRFHDIGAFDAVTPTAAALVSAVARPDGVRLRFTAGDAAGRVAIERRTESSDWTMLAELAPDGDGRVSYDDREVTPGGRYAYRLRVGDTATEPTWVTVPVRAEFALHGARPNPLAGGEPVAAFALPTAERATVELFDLAGRRVRAVALDAPSPGEHALRLAGPAPLAPGVYTLRLAQGARVATSRLSVVR